MHSTQRFSQYQTNRVRCNFPSSFSGCRIFFLQLETTLSRTNLPLSTPLHTSQHQGFYPNFSPARKKVSQFDFVQFPPPPPPPPYNGPFFTYLHLVPTNEEKKLQGGGEAEKRPRFEPPFPLYFLSLLGLSYLGPTSMVSEIHLLTREQGSLSRRTGTSPHGPYRQFIDLFYTVVELAKFPYNATYFFLAIVTGLL